MGKWITVHGHHVYLKDPSEMDDSLKGKQFKNPMRVRTRFGNFVDSEPDEDMKKAATDVDDTLGQIYKDQNNPNFGRGYDSEGINTALYDYYPQTQPDDDSEKLIRHNDETGDMTFARITANNNRTVDVRIHKGHEDEYSDEELRNSFGIEERAKDRMAKQATMISPAVKALINRKSKHFTAKVSDDQTTVLYQNTQNKAWAKVFKPGYGSGYGVIHGNMLGDLANDLHGANGTAVRLYDTAEAAHKGAQQYLIKMNRRGY